MGNTNYATRIAELERNVEQLRKQLAESALQGTAYASAIAALLTKVEAAHKDIAELRDLARGFIHRQEVDHRIDDLQDQIALLQQNFLSLSEKTHDAIIGMAKDNHTFQQEVLKALSSHTKAIYGVLFAVVLTVVGWFAVPALEAYFQSTNTPTPVVQEKR